MKPMIFLLALAGVLFLPSVCHAYTYLLNDTEDAACEFWVMFSEPVEITSFGDTLTEISPSELSDQYVFSGGSVQPWVDGHWLSWTPATAELVEYRWLVTQEGDPSRAESEEAKIAVGGRAPDFQLLNLDRKAVSLSDFRGEVVILNFWASWCVPCRSAMPGLIGLSRALNPEVVLLGVSLDRTVAAASDFLASNDYTEMILLYRSYDAAIKVFRQYNGEGIPHTLVIDRQGMIRFIGHPALLTRKSIQALISEDTGP